MVRRKVGFHSGDDKVRGFRVPLRESVSVHHPPNTKILQLEQNLIQPLSRMTYRFTNKFNRHGCKWYELIHSYFKILVT